MRLDRTIDFTENAFIIIFKDLSFMFSLLVFSYLIIRIIMPLIQHYSLRLILTLNKIFPFRITPFLDYCVDLIFLRRVGGGYIFVHRLLMEHFAEMYNDNEPVNG